MTRSTHSRVPRVANLGRVVLLGLVLGGTLSGGCSATLAASSHLDGMAKQLHPPTGYALVYVIRPEFMGQAVRFDILVNGTWIGATGGFRYVFTYLRPGHYLFQSRAENVASLRLSVHPGRVYFLEQRPRMGLFMAQNDLILLPEQVGRRRLRLCALSAAMPREVLAYAGSAPRAGDATVSVGTTHGPGPGLSNTATTEAPGQAPPAAKRRAPLPVPARDTPPPATSPGPPPPQTESF